MLHRQPLPGTLPGGTKARAAGYRTAGQRCRAAWRSSIGGVAGPGAVTEGSAHSSLAPGKRAPWANANARQRPQSGGP